MIAEAETSAPVWTMPHVALNTPIIISRFTDMRQPIAGWVVEVKTRSVEALSFIMGSGLTHFRQLWHVSDPTLETTARKSLIEENLDMGVFDLSETEKQFRMALDAMHKYIVQLRDTQAKFAEQFAIVEELQKTVKDMERQLVKVSSAVRVPVK
jgi:hypothetical protein